MIRRFQIRPISTKKMQAQQAYLRAVRRAVARAETENILMACRRHHDLIHNELRRARLLGLGG